MTDAFILDAVRTPRGRGRPDGSLHTITPVQLAAQTLAAGTVPSHWRTRPALL